MPSPTEILVGLTAIANGAIGLAVAWHVVLAGALLALAAGWRPSRRTARIAIAVPLASVAVLAFAFGNPFNGLVFAFATATVVALGATAADRTAVARGPRWSYAVGCALLVFAWVYPYFVVGDQVVYLYAAPLGLIPCPTLSMAIGLALLGGGLGSRAWSRALAAFGLFFGLFGVLRLGVSLDLPLVAGAAILGVVAERAGAHGPAGHIGAAGAVSG